MTYQGERARPMSTERGRHFEVSKVRIGPDGHVSDVLWGEINSASDLKVGKRVVATVAEVVDAIHDGAQVAAVFTKGDPLPQRMFLVVEQNDGSEHITIDGTPYAGRNASDLEKLVDHAESASNGHIGEYRNDQPKNSRMQTFGYPRAQVLAQLYDGLRTVPERDEHLRLALVRGSRRRQNQFALDRVSDRA